MCSEVSNATAGQYSVEGRKQLEVVVLIAAYRPGAVLCQIVKRLTCCDLTAIVVVDDGSGSEYRNLFDGLSRYSSVHVLRHAINLGKGAALKTAINFALVEYPELAGVVTADADGQHDPDDIVKVARRFIELPQALVLGSRTFRSDTPWRSRVGNSITNVAMQFAVGHRLSDTQTGLRAIPRGLLERLLRVPASGYEFELEMLITARHPAIDIVEQPIRTIYEPGNRSSHFQPLRDSMRIYFVLLRFGLLSLMTAMLDNAVFFLLYRACGVFSLSLAGARVLPLFFNYSLVRDAVFHSRERHRDVLPRYLTIAAAYVCVSYALITLLGKGWAIGVVPAKILVESALFAVNFAIQRDFVFARVRRVESCPS